MVALPAATRQPVALSAPQRWIYCPRQCGLIHLEQVFADIRTARGEGGTSFGGTPGYEIASPARLSERGKKRPHAILSINRYDGREISVWVGKLP